MFKIKNLLIPTLVMISSCGGGESITQPAAIIAPVANAGTDLSIDEQTQVTLSGSGQDADGTVETYQWTQISGTPVTLDRSTNASITFTGPTLTVAETLVFGLTVTDNGGVKSNTDQVSVVVNPVNIAPVANGVADIEILVNQDTYQSTLTGSDEDGNAITFLIQSQPLFGSLSLDSNTGDFSYIPKGETGSDQFSFFTSDSSLSSNVVTVNISISTVALSEGESNNESSTANKIFQKSTVSGALSEETDVDWYQFVAFETGSIELNLDVPTNSTDEYFLVIVTDSSGNELERIESGVDVLFYASVNAGESYYIQIIKADNFISDEYVLGIENYISGQAELNWNAPTKNKDDSELLDLAGFEIYYAISGTQLEKQAEIFDPTIKTATIKHFRFDGTTYDFAVKAKNTCKILSPFSETVSKTFNNIEP